LDIQTIIESELDLVESEYNPYGALAIALNPIKQRVSVETIHYIQMNHSLIQQRDCLYKRFMIEGHQLAHAK